MALIFGPDSFVVGVNTNIDAYGNPSYAYSQGTGAELTVNAAAGNVQPTVISTDLVARIIDPDFSSLAIQEVRLVGQGSGTGTQIYGAALRYGIGGDGYVLYQEVDTANISEFVGGVFTLLASAIRSLGLNVNYTLAGRANGSALSVIIDGTTAVTATDGTRATGAPGIFMFRSSLVGTTFLDDLEVDDLTTQIFIVSQGAQLASIAASFSPVIPAFTAGDLALLFIAGRPTDTSLVTVSAGWTEDTNSRVVQEVGANDLRGQVFLRVLQAGDPNPTVTLPAAWQGAAAGASGQILVLRGVDPATPLDTASVVSTSGSSFSFQPTGITTVSPFAQAVSFVASSDDNRLRCNVPRNFTAWMGGDSYDTTTGGDHSVGVASRQVTTPVAISAPTWEQEINGSDSWIGVSLALRPIGAGGGIAGDRMLRGVGR